MDQFDRIVEILDAGRTEGADGESLYHRLAIAGFTVVTIDGAAGTLRVAGVGSSPRVCALVERIRAGGDEAAADVCEALLEVADAEEIAYSPDDPERESRLRRLAGEE